MSCGSRAVKAHFDTVEDPTILAQIIVDAVREPLLVLDADMRIRFASKSFYTWFRIDPADTHERKLFTLDGGAWDIPALRKLLQFVLHDKTIIQGYEIAHDFPRVGRRVLLLNARRAATEHGAPAAILLGFEDVTEQRAIEHEKERLQRQTNILLVEKDLMVREMQHRIVNSLQIIASILMLKTRSVNSEETRQHLQDAHRRVMSVAAVQQHLHTSLRGDRIEVAPYLKKLCESLADSMIGEDRPATLEVTADNVALVSADAVSLGLIVTELVINALKYAFPDHAKAAAVKVRYDVNGADWTLSVSDNGVGKTDGGGAHGRGGLGTSLVNALASQLDAKVEWVSSTTGLTVSITHKIAAAAAV
jgi:chemotaxis protein methyltransferase CheR